MTSIQRILTIALFSAVIAIPSSSFAQSTDQPLTQPASALAPVDMPDAPELPSQNIAEPASFDAQRSKPLTHHHTPVPGPIKSESDFHAQRRAGIVAVEKTDTMPASQRTW